MKHIFSVIDMKLRTVILLKFIVVISLMLDDICAQNPATLPTNIRVIPEEGQLRISWTISPDAKSSDFYRIRGVTRNKTEVTQYLSWTENQLLLKATPCVLYAVQLCVGVSYFGITECILQTATPLPHPPSRPKSLLVTNNPVVSGQDVTWTAPDALEPFCALYYEVRYGPDPLPNNVVQVTEITFRATSLPWHTLITYEVRAAYQNPASVGSPATFSLKTVDGPDLTVTDLVVTKSNTLITVQWKGPWWASFNVGYGENGTNVVIPASYGQTRYSFQTAKPCTHFFVWVVAFTRLNYAHPATLVVQTDPEAQPSYPTNVRVHPTCGTLTVTWEHDGTKYHVINYEVIVTRAGTTDSIIKTVQKAKSIMFSGLVCDKPYLVTVSAVNACGRSIESNPIYVIAQNQVPASKLTSFTVKTTHNSLEAVWASTQPTTVRVDYIINLTEVDTARSTPIRDSVTTSMLSASFQRLPSCVTFTVSVCARNPFGESPYIINTARTRPPEPEAPDDVKVSHYNLNTHQLSWQVDSEYPSTCGLYYEINVTSSSSSWFKTFRTSTGSLLVGNLDFGEEYNYVIRARTELPDVSSIHVGPISLYNPAQDHHTFTNIWTYVVAGVVAFLCLTLVITAIFCKKC